MCVIGVICEKRGNVDNSIFIEIFFFILKTASEASVFHGAGISTEN